MREKGQSYDLTEGQIYSLSDQTKEVLKGLEYPVQITVWSDQEKLEEIDRQRSSRTGTLLRFYEQESEKIELRYKNPIENPQIFRSYNLPTREGLGAIVIRKMVLPERIVEEQFKNFLEELSGIEAGDRLRSVYKKEGAEYILEGGVQEDRSRREEIGGIFESVGYQYTRYETLLQNQLSMGGKYQGEGRITRKIIDLEGREEFKLCVTSGHGEKSFEKEYGLFKELLDLEAYKVEEVDLFKEVVGCDVLMVAGLLRDFIAEEVKNLEGYLEGGGRGLFLLDADFESERAGRRGMKLERIGNFLKGYGIRLGDGFIYDPKNIRQVQFLTGLGFFVRNVHRGEYEDHEIVEKSKEEGLSIYFDGLRGLYFESMEGVEVEAFLRTSELGWEEKEGKNDNQKNEFGKKDIRGPINFGLTVIKKEKKEAVAGKQELKEASEDEEKMDSEKMEEEGITGEGITGEGIEEEDEWVEKSRLLLIGDSDFINDEYASQFGSGQDLLMNSLNWLTDRGEEISIRPKERRNRVLDLTQESMEIIFYLCVIILPFSVVGLGARVYVKRRKLN